MAKNSTMKPSVKGKNPNPEPMLNDAPEGPFGPCMGEPGYSGMKGDTSAKGKNGENFEFK